MDYGFKCVIKYWFLFTDNCTTYGTRWVAGEPAFDAVVAESVAAGG